MSLWSRRRGESSGSAIRVDVLTRAANGPSRQFGESESAAIRQSHAPLAGRVWSSIGGTWGDLLRWGLRAGTRRPVERRRPPQARLPRIVRPPGQQDGGRGRARAKFTILAALESGIPPSDLRNRSVSTVGFIWQKVGYLVRGGHVDRQLVYRNLGDQVQVWWVLLYPDQLGHGASNVPDAWPDFEWLAGVAAALRAKQGIDRIDAESVRAELPGMIAHFREAIETEEALRAVTVRLTPTPIPVTGVRAQHVDAAT